MTADFQIEERSDARGNPVVMIKRDGANLTARWTHEDADNELAHLNGSARTGTSHADQYAELYRLLKP